MIMQSNCQVNAVALPAIVAILPGVSVGANINVSNQGIVATMVSVNVIHIASIGVCFAAMVTGIVIPLQHARWIVAVGFTTSIAVYLVGWLGNHGEGADVVSHSGFDCEQVYWHNLP